jgi:hypothetical protein
MMPRYNYANGYLEAIAHTDPINTIRATVAKEGHAPMILEMSHDEAAAFCSAILHVLAVQLEAKRPRRPKGATA